MRGYFRERRWLLRVVVVVVVVVRRGVCCCCVCVCVCSSAAGCRMAERNSSKQKRTRNKALSTVIIIGRQNLLSVQAGVSLMTIAEKVSLSRVILI